MDYWGKKEHFNTFTCTLSLKKRQKHHTFKTSQTINLSNMTIDSGQVYWILGTLIKDTNGFLKITREWVLWKLNFTTDFTKINLCLNFTSPWAFKNTLKYQKWWKMWNLADDKDYFRLSFFRLIATPKIIVCWSGIFFFEALICKRCPSIMVLGSLEGNGSAHYSRSHQPVLPPI